MALPDVDPVLRAVAGRREPAALHAGFQQHRGVAVAVLPVGGEPAGGAGEVRRGEVRHPHVGADEEAGVAGDEVQALLAGGGVPADVGVAGGAFQAAAAKPSAATVPTASVSTR